MFRQINPENTALLPGLFKERADVNRAYLMELKTENLLQNFYLEACIRTERDISDMHLGWESPTCQLRGHFLGHWLSAASVLVAENHDRELKAKLDNIIDELARCQKLNGGRWIGSIPENILRDLKKTNTSGRRSTLCIKHCSDSTTVYCIPKMRLPFPSSETPQTGISTGLPICRTKIRMSSTVARKAECWRYGPVYMKLQTTSVSSHSQNATPTRPFSKNLQTAMTRFQTAMQMQVFRGRTERQKCMRLQGMRNGFRW